MKNIRRLMENFKRNHKEIYDHMMLANWVVDYNDAGNGYVLYTTENELRLFEIERTIKLKWPLNQEVKIVHDRIKIPFIQLQDLVNYVSHIELVNVLIRKALTSDYIHCEKNVPIIINDHYRFDCNLFEGELFITSDLKKIYKEFKSLHKKFSNIDGNDFMHHIVTIYGYNAINGPSENVDHLNQMFEEEYDFRLEDYGIEFTEFILKDSIEDLEVTKL